MIDLKEYILLPKETRQAHTDLSTPCVERGGNSTNHKGVLAQYLNTTIPSGRILLCHACGNGNCSEPRHLYWGTDRENIVEDGKLFGTWKSPRQRMIEKYGTEESSRIQSRAKIGNTYGSGNKDKSKSEEHKNKIAEARKNQTNNNGGRKRITPYEDIVKLVSEKGFKDSALHLNISLAALKGRYYNAVKALKISGLGENGQTQET